MSWLTAAIFLLVPAIAWLARRSGGSWYSPAAFFAAFWCVFGGLPLIGSPVSVAPAGMLFVAGASAAVLAGARLAQRWRPAVRAPHATPTEPPMLGWLIAACTLLGLAVVAIIVYDVETGSNGTRLISFGAIVETIHRLAVARNGGTWEEPAAARVLTTAMYLGAMLCGVMLGLRTSPWSRWLSLLVFVPSVIVTIVLTTKSSLLLPLALAVSAYLATAIVSGNAPTLTLKRAVLLAGTSFSLIGLLGLGLGAIMRHTAAAIAVLVGGVYLAAQFVGAVAHGAAGYMPVLIIGNSLSTTKPVTCAPHASLCPHFLSAWAGLGMLCLYAAVVLVIGGWLLARRDA